MKATEAMKAVLRATYDTWAESPDKWTTLKNRYHSPAYLLAQAGLVEKRDNVPFRPTYRITELGRAKWETAAPSEAEESRTYWGNRR